MCSINGNIFRKLSLVKVFRLGLIFRKLGYFSLHASNFRKMLAAATRTRPLLLPLQFCLQNTHQVTQTLALPLSFLRTAFAHEGFRSGLVSVHFESPTVTGITASINKLCGPSYGVEIT